MKTESEKAEYALNRHIELAPTGVIKDGVAYTDGALYSARLICETQNIEPTDENRIAIAGMMLRHMEHLRILSTMPGKSEETPHRVS